MADSTTLLTYQITYEMRIFDLMTNSQQMGDYVMACMYGESLLEYLETDELPEKPIGGKTRDQQTGEWMVYYTLLFKQIMRKVRININAVRKQYGKELVIPKYVKQPSGN